MDFSDYQKLAMRTCKWNKPCEEMLTNVGLGLAGECGEVADQIKKHILGTKPLEKDQFVEELGDVLWYLAEAAQFLEIDMNELPQSNISKLKKRHPTGFDGWGNR